ncbi:MAG TPA: hypothetical protein VIK91_11590 [Nannocystis sp.]
MSRRAAPLAAALAVSLACPEVFAASPVPSSLAFRTIGSQPTETTVVVETGPAAPAPEPAPAPEAQPYVQSYPAPQPYADPSATGQPDGPPTVGTISGPPPLPPKRRKGLMIGGWVMFGTSYLATAFVAAVVHDACTRNPNCRNAATMTLIPAIGPFLAIPYMKTDAITPRVLMAFPALIQLAGLTMAIVGTAQFVRDGRQPRLVDVDGIKLGARLRLGAGPTPFLDGGTLTLGARF